MNETLPPTSKVCLDGAQRALLPIETLERMRPFWGAAGITRVCDITGLDSLGIPVALAIRPDSASLAVDSGKGATIAAAKASAMMEAFERVTVERWQCEEFTLASPSNLGPKKALWDFPLLRGARVDPELPIRWAPASDLLTGAEMLVPERCVGLDVGRAPEAFAHRAWFSSTNGLAAGNTREEAVCAAIYEVIERDALTLCYEADSRAVVKHEAIPWASVQELLERIAQADCGVTIADATSDLGVPAYLALIFDRKDPGVGVYRGYGAHLSPEVAMCRAVCEAAQARCVIVAGARDDITHERYQAFRRIAAETEISRWDMPQLIEAMPADASSPSFREDIAILLERLEPFGHVLMYDFDVHKHLHAHVVRILIPGLEGYWCDWIERGPRARQAGALRNP
jgi:YcaO-like protein with predicted kinase domain